MFQAVKKGFLGNFPRITSQMIAANLPNTIATSKGHLDQTRQGQHSTKPPPPTKAVETEITDDTNIAFLKVLPISETIHSDLTGRFPIVSSKGNQYLFVSVLNGIIHMEAMPSRSGAAYVKAFSDTIQFYESKSAKITYQRLDNESSGLVEKFLPKTFSSNMFILTLIVQTKQNVQFVMVRIILLHVLLQLILIFLLPYGMKFFLKQKLL